MRLFNAFQITGAFVAWPFLIAWLPEATFRGHGPALVAAVILYIIAFGAMVNTVYEAMRYESHR